MDIRLRKFLEGCSEDEVEDLRKSWLARPRKVVAAERRERFADDVEDRLAWLMLAESKGKKHFRVARPLRHWGAFGIFGLGEGEPEALPQEEHRARVNALINTGMWLEDSPLFPDIIPPDVGRVGLHEAAMAPGEYDGEAWRFTTLRQVLAAGPKGFGRNCYFRKSTGYAWLFLQVSLSHRGELTVISAASIGWSPETSYVRLDFGNHYHGQANATKALGEIIVSSLNRILERRYDWRVEMGYPGHPNLSFSTDPCGIRYLYADRDVGPRKRRAALRHWVTEHWRRYRADEAARHWVRAHLRGATKFTWNGLDCCVLPSAFDLERAYREQYRRQAREFYSKEWGADTPQADQLWNASCAHSLDERDAKRAPRDIVKIVPVRGVSL